MANKFGGAQPGSGRKKGVTDQEVREQLQKYFPEVYESVHKDLTDPLYKIPVSTWKILDKFIGDRKISEIENKDGKEFVIRITSEAQGTQDEE